MKQQISHIAVFILTAVILISLIMHNMPPFIITGSLPAASIQTYPDNVMETASIATSAQSAVLIDAQSTDIIYENNAYKRLPMASTTKIMTVIVAIESGVPLDGIYKITKEMTGIEGSSIYLYENELFRLTDLLYAVMLNSANDAATAVAICVAGSVEAFAGMMNKKAAGLGLENTHFTNPHGLDAELHYTSAYDLAVITADALKNDLFREITSTKNKVIYPKNPDGTDYTECARYLRNHNRMLTMYDGVIGGKTGFTKRSGRCLVSAAERDGVRLVAVTINAPSDWNDHKNMLDYGFGNYRYINLCGENGFTYQIPVVTALSTVDVTNQVPLGASLPNTVDESVIKRIVELPRFLYIMPQSGDILGRLIFELDGKIIAQTNIVSR